MAVNKWLVLVMKGVSSLVSRGLDLIGLCSPTYSQTGQFAVQPRKESSDAYPSSSVDREDVLFREYWEHANKCLTSKEFSVAGSV
jgi:hypothetical protein